MAKTTGKRKRKKRPYSMEYTARQNPRRYLLSGIPPTLWENVRAQAKREHIAMRQLILTLLEGWLLSRDPKTQVANALQAARDAITPERKQQLAERAARDAKRGPA